MFWIEMIKMMIFIISLIIGFRAGVYIDKDFKRLKWYDKIFRCYYITYTITMTILMFIAFVS